MKKKFIQRSGGDEQKQTRNNNVHVPEKCVREHNRQSQPQGQVKQSLSERHLAMLFMVPHITQSETNVWGETQRQHDGASCEIQAVPPCKCIKARPTFQLYCCNQFVPSEATTKMSNARCSFACKSDSSAGMSRWNMYSSTLPATTNSNNAQSMITWSARNACVNMIASTKPMPACRMCSVRDTLRPRKWNAVSFAPKYRNGRKQTKRIAARIAHEVSRAKWDCQPSSAGALFIVVKKLGQPPVRRAGPIFNPNIVLNWVGRSS